MESDLLQVWGIGPSKAMDGGFARELLEHISGNSTINTLLAQSFENGGPPPPPTPSPSPSPPPHGEETEEENEANGAVAKHEHGGK